ncbi:MAG: hypothetical protein A4E65_02654 [Syntrophorhabdus sp. PtaU1.Bin153]|nr:MAG: hypothetical protein A4E65_02654 [Syntrophorhabdus sp. PtaU1.Bin153]
MPDLETTEGSTAYSEAENAGETAGGSVYGPLIKSQLAEEAGRKTSFEQRGVAVITTSGVLVSLLFGLAAVVTKSDTFVLPIPAKNFLVVSLILFVLAAVAGIISNWPLRYLQVEVSELKRFIEPKLWSGSSETAARRVAEAQVAVLARSRKLNLLKGRALLAGMILEVAAVVSLAMAVGFILLKAT